MSEEEKTKMQKVLIDTFIVPEESKAKFLERARHVQRFLKHCLDLLRVFSMRRRTDKAGSTL